MLDFSRPLEAIATHHPLTQVSHTASSARRQRPLVILVDDDIDNLKLISYVLEEFNCLLICEADGAAALKLIRKLQPALVVLDIRLPGLSGLEMVHGLKLRRTTCAIPVIAVTALASIKDKRKILQAGCNQYISKPYLLDDMRRLISQYLHPCPKVEQA